MLDVTAFFAGLLGLMLVALSANVIFDRYRYRIAIGSGNNPMTERKIRAQANFAEYVPMALILMGVCENGGIPKGLLFGLGYLLLAGRISHAYSLLWWEPNKNGRIPFRQMGMVATFTTIVILSGMALSL